MLKQEELSVYLSLSTELMKCDVCVYTMVLGLYVRIWQWAGTGGCRGCPLLDKECSSQHQKGLLYKVEPIRHMVAPL